MDQVAFLEQIKDYKLGKQKLINDTFLWVSLSTSSLKTISKSEKFLKKQEFKVPSTVKGKTIKRKPKQIQDILDKAANESLYESTFIYVVAQFEAFLVDIISLNLKFDQRKLRLNVSGGKSDKKIDVKDILDCPDHDGVISLIIDKILGDLFYAGPKKQKEYIEKGLKVKLEEVLWDKWFEYKATRDLLVHNSGTINNIYLEKAGERARGELGEKVKITEGYFKDSLSDIKSMIGRIESRIRKNL